MATGCNSGGLRIEPQSPPRFYLGAARGIMVISLEWPSAYSTPNTLPVHVTENILEIDEDQVQPRSKLRALFQYNPWDVDVVNVEGSRAETNLLSVGRALEKFFDAFQDYYSHDLRNSSEQKDIPSIIALKTGPLLCNRNDLSLLPLSGK